MKKSQSACPLCGGLDPPRLDEAPLERLGAEQDDHAPTDALHVHANTPSEEQNHHQLQHIIFKHLHIKIIENRVDRVCVLCKQTVTDWDRFAQKCWDTQDLLNETLKIKNNIKAEASDYVEVKIEQPCDDYENDHFKDDNDEDDKYSMLRYGSKTDDDPLYEIETKRSSKKSSKRKGSLSSIKLKKKSRAEKSLKKSSSDEALNESRSLDEEAENIPLEIIAKANTSDGTGVTQKLRKRSKKLSAFIEFNCYVCGVKLNTWCGLRRHFAKLHPSSKAKVLCICGKYLSALNTVYRHCNKHDEAKGFKCGECGKKFSDKRVFKKHMYEHFPEDDFAYTCPQCPKKFVLIEGLQKHMKMHLPPELKYTYTCDICGDKFATKFYLQTHKLAKHDQIRNHTCDICGHSFAMKGNLESHMKTIHSEERNFECDKCDKKFKIKKDLKKHQDNVHFDGQLKCPLCPAVLKNMRTFRRHKDIHDNIYRYSCHLCGKEFRKSDHLKTHMNSHDGVRPYACQWCSMAYANKPTLISHINKTHPDALIKPDISKVEVF